YVDSPLDLATGRLSPSNTRYGLSHGTCRAETQSVHSHNWYVMPISQISLDRLRPLLRQIVVIPAGPGCISITGDFEDEASSIGYLAGDLVQLSHSLIGKDDAARAEEDHRSILNRVFVKIVPDVLDIGFDSGYARVGLFGRGDGAVSGILSVPNPRSDIR